MSSRSPVLSSWGLYPRSLPVLMIACFAVSSASAQLPSPAARASMARVNEVLENTSNILYELSDHYFHNGDYGQSIRIGHLVEDLSPDFLEPYSVVAWLEWSDGDSNSAVEDLKRGISRNPGVYELYSEMGDCYQLWLKRPADAMPYYIKATSYYQEAPWVVFEALGHTSEKVRDYSRAAVAYRTALLKAGPESEVVPARRNLQRVLSRMGEVADGEPVASNLLPGSIYQ